MVDGPGIEPGSARCTLAFTRVDNLCRPCETRRPEQYRRTGQRAKLSTRRARTCTSQLSEAQCRLLSVYCSATASPSGIPRTQYPPPEATGKLVAHGAGTHLDVGSAHRIFRGLRSGPAPRTPAGRLDKAGHRTGARAVPPKQYGGPQATTS